MLLFLLSSQIFFRLETLQKIILQREAWPASGLGSRDHGQDQRHGQVRDHRRDHSHDRRCDHSFDHICNHQRD